MNFQKNVYYNSHFSSFRFKFKNMNKIKRFELRRCRHFVAKKQKRNHAFRDIHVQKNVIDEMQL